MGMAIAVLLVVGVVGAYVGTRSAPIGRVASGPGHCASSSASSPSARDFRLLLTHVRHPGAGDRRDARRRRLRLSLGARSTRARRRSCSCASSARRCCSRRPGVRSDSGSARSAATSPPRWCSRWPPCCWWCAVGLADVGVRARPRSSGSGTPVPRSSRWRCSRTRRPSTPVVRERTGRASTPASGPPARRWGWHSGRGCLCAGAGAGRLRRPLTSTTSPRGFQPDSALTAIVLGFSLHPGRADPASLLFLSRYSLDADVVRELDREEGVPA